MDSLKNIFWLGLKEIRSLASDKVMLLFDDIFNTLIEKFGSYFIQ